MESVAAVNGDAHRQGAEAVGRFTDLLRDRYTFLQPTLNHRQVSTDAAKALLDPLAQAIVKAQENRRRENRKKRKRGDVDLEESVLQLRQIHTKGLGVPQVWGQARRILDAACNEIEKAIDQYTPVSANGGVQGFRDAMDIDEEEHVEPFSEEDVSASDLETGDEEDVEVLDEEDEEDIEDDSDILSSEEGEEEEDASGDEILEQPSATFVADPNKLNDGFFSIDDFNKQSQFLEQIDARGEDDNVSDEDEINWDADPLATSQLPPRESRRPGDENVDQESDDEAGPIFGNANLQDMDSEEDDIDPDGVENGGLEDMMPGLSNTNDILYADFFEPPPQKPSKNKRMRALPKTQPPKPGIAKDELAEVDQDDVDLERAMADVKRDLLESDEELEEEDDELSDAGSDTLPPLPASKRNDSNLSTHEKQKMQIALEIRRLEAINVSKKPWTLSGQASAQARPLNSLIEEDLEFERTGKPVPVITAEVSTDIEALIKRRILARDFDEIVRRLPNSLEDAVSTRRGRADVVIDDHKATTSLGELYEQEYQKNADPSAYVDKRSAAIRKQHDEIDRLWKEVREQLDVLGNLHFKPKRAEIEIKTVEDKPRIAMEDARPTGGDYEGGTLAPQEIYKPGTDSRARQADEILMRGGASAAKEEMTREEKLRRRRREKERSKKAQDNRAQKVLGRKDKKTTRKEEKADIAKDLTRGDVKIIGKHGELQKISSSKREKSSSGVQNSSALKL